jgi:hypothetical protein
MPDLAYQKSQKDSVKFEEDPTKNNPLLDASSNPLYKDTLALRLRFAGWGLVQMATDPDPPTDEVGCTGTHMLHAADGDRKFDRALVWQDNNQDHIILRNPREDLPTIGVNCVDVSLIVTDGVANAGYTPLQIMQSIGAVQTPSGIQQDLNIQGFLDILTLTPKELLGEKKQIRMDLLQKDVIYPFLNGENHLVWQSGEPIDPFVLAVLVDRPLNMNAQTKPELVFQREVFNQGMSLLQMSPIQRLLSARGPCGFDFDLNHIPEWAKSSLSNKERDLLDSSEYPISYLSNRARMLAKSLSEQLRLSDDSQEGVDIAISLAERMLLVSVPPGTTENWLTILLHYGHTISGTFSGVKDNNPILSAFAERTNIQTELSTDTSNRDVSNSRWLMKYTMGLMDTDALSDFVYGELYIPVTLKPTDQSIEIYKRWIFPSNMKSSVSQFACRFDKPFWASFEVHDDKRTLKLPNYIIVEYLQRPEGNDSYNYTMTGIKDVVEFRGTFAIVDSGSSNDQLSLEWRVSFKCYNTLAIINMLTIIVRDSQKMTTRMQDYFGPHVK